MSNYQQNKSALEPDNRPNVQVGMSESSHRHGSDSEDELTDVFSAIEAGDEEKVKLFLKPNGSIEVNEKKKDNTLLHIAVKRNRENIVRVLLEMGANVNVKNNNNNTPLHIALKKVYIKIAELLLEKNRDRTFKWNIDEDNRKKALELVDKKPSASFNNSWQSIKALLEPSKPSASGMKRPPDNAGRGSGSKESRVDVDASGSKRQDANQDGNPPKRPKIDPAFDPYPTYAASGVKRALNGTIYQSKLLELFVKRGIAKEYDFRLATEMDAAEKFDDVVFKFKESTQGEKWNWRFLQAKHKQDPEHNKITINDLISTSNDNPFSLQKYFVSFCRINNNDLFKPKSPDEQIDLNNFVIITNTDFEFSENLEIKKDGGPTKRAQEHNELINKWKCFFEKENDLERDEILYFKNKDFRAKKLKFNDNAKTELTETIKSSLLKSALEAREIKGLSSAKKILESVKVCNQNHLIIRANEAIKNIEEEYCNKKRKGQLLSEAKEVLKLKGKILKENRFSNLTHLIKELDKTAAIDKKDQRLNNAIKKVLEEANGISNEVNYLFNEAEKALSESKVSTSNTAKVLEEDKKKLSDIENRLKKIRAKISKSETTLDDIKEEIKYEVLTKRIPKVILDGIKNKTSSDLEEVKITLDKRLGEAISEISVIRVALNDDTLDNYLREFLDKFRFVTNYPNEKELGSLIKNELGKEFNLLNADLVNDSFEREMLDFLKSYDKGKAKFYSWKDGEEFFEALKGKINTLMTSGLNKSYPEKLRVYGIRFKEKLKLLKEFLSDKGENIFHVSTQATRLSAIKALKTLEGEELNSCYNYLGKRDGYIFMRLRTLLHHQGLQEYIMNSFDKQGTHDLLVIECQSKTQGNIDGLYNIIKYILDNNKQKKIVLIAQEEDLIARKFKNSHKGKYRKETDQISFEDLDGTSQSKILEKKVNFQGKDISLNELLDKNSAGGIIDQAILLKLLEGEKIVLGDEKAFSSVGYVKDYYIERKFYRQWIKTEVLKDKAGSELFFITGADNENLTDLGVENKDIHTWEYRKKYNNGIILPSSSKNGQEIFQDLGKSHPRKSIHWLEYRDHNIFWKAKGTSSPVDKNNEIYYDSEKDFSKPDPNAKVVIVANDSGMGKSTVLTSIAHKMKESSAALWVVRVNLNDYAIDEKQPQSLHNIKFEESETEKAIDFVSKMAIYSAPDEKDSKNMEFQQKLFKLGLKKLEDASGQNPKIVILFDGFDEISPNYKANTTKLIRALKESKVIQLWATTRVHERAYLEKELESPSYTLNPLTEQEQKSFLGMFWKWNLKFHKDSYSQEVYERTYEEILEHLRQIKLPDIDFTSQLTEDISKILKAPPFEADDKLEELRETIDELDLSYYASGLLDQWNKSIDDRGKEFTLVPLHLKMLTEVVFQKKFQLNKELRLLDLYDEFIKVKFDIYHQDKNKIRKGNVGANDTVKRDLDNLSRIHHELAFKLFFAEEHEKKLLPGLNEQSRFKNQELTRVGLLILKGNNLEFVHRSFGEYFLSEYLVRNLENEQVQKLLLEKILVKKDYELIRKFFSGQLEKSPTSIKLTEAGKNSIAKDLEKNYHKETLLHLIANEGHYGIYEFLFKSIQDNAELLNELMTKTYNQGLTALHLAIWGDHDKIVKYLLYNGLKLDPETFKNKILKLESGEGTPLCLAAYSGYNNIVTLILNFVKDHLGKIFLDEFVLETSIQGENALYLASDQGHTEVVQTLLNFVKRHLGEVTLKELVIKANKSNQGDKSKAQTALHRAAKKGYTEIVHELLDGIKEYPETLKELVLKTDYYGATTLQEAVYKDERYSFSSNEDGKREIVSAILKYINDPKALEDLVILSTYGNTRRDPEEIVDNLLKSVEHNSEIHKKLTSIKNRLNEVKLKSELLNKAIDLRDKDEVQKIFNESQAYVKELVLENGGPNGRTTLINASDRGLSEIVENILDHIKYYPKILEELVLKVDRFEEETALHRAARNDNHHTVLKVLNFVKDHLGKDSLKKALLKRKANGTSAIYAAHYRDRHQTVKVILEFVENYLPEILEKQVEEIGGIKETLHWADSMGYLDLKQRLLDRIGLQAQRKFAFFEAVDNGNSTAIKALLEGVKNDNQALKDLLTASDNDGNTLLDLAPPNTTNVLLNWVKENLREDLPHTTLKKLVLASGKIKVRDINFLNMVNENLEKEHPGILKKLLMKAFFEGKTALSLGFWGDTSEIYYALELLGWVKNNTNEETFNDLVLATDNRGETALHSAAFDLGFGYKTEAVLDLLEAFKDHPKIFKEVVLKPNISGQTVLHKVAREAVFAAQEQKTKRVVPVVRSLLEMVKDDFKTLKDLVLATDDSKYTALDLVAENENNDIVDLLKAQYDEIASSLLIDDTNIADFSSNQLHLIEKYVYSKYFNGNNKSEILQKLAKINSERS